MVLLAILHSTYEMHTTCHKTELLFEDLCVYYIVVYDQKYHYTYIYTTKYNTNKGR